MTTPPSKDQAALSALQVVYSHQLDKNDFGTLLQSLDEAIWGLTSTEFEAEAIPARLSAFESLDDHFDLATRLDFKLSEEDEEREIAELCDSNASCFAANQDGMIIGISQNCRTKLGDIARKPIEQLPLRNSDVQALRTAIQDITAEDATRQRDRALFVRHSDDEKVAIFHLKHFRKSRVVVVLFDHLVWTDFVEDAVKRNFALTQAECNIVQQLVAGKRPAEIAVELKRSVETVRSHIKSAQSKTHSRDTTALIRLMCEIMTISNDITVQDAASENTEYEFPTPYLMSDGGLRYEATRMVGLSNSSPERTALFIHGMLQGPFLSKDLKRLLREDNIEMISPSRPGYGGTAAAQNKEQFLQQSMDQMLHLLDAHKIEKTILVGHMVGTQFATRLAAYAPDRVLALVSISGVIPMMSKSQLKQQNTMHRMAMLAAKYSPATLRYISQVGERYLREGNEIRCLQQLFSRSESDKAALKAPEISAILKGGFRHLIGNGKSAFMFETQTGIDDWQEAFRNLSCPSVILHGEADVAVPAKSLREIMPQFPDWDFNFFEDAGQTLLHTHPGDIAAHLNATFAETLTHELTF